MRQWFLRFSVICLSLVLGIILFPSYAHSELLISNTEGNNVVIFDDYTGHYQGELISSQAGLESPDMMAYRADGYLYISSGNTPEASAILRFDLATRKLIDRFATGGGLIRPYGLAFSPDGNLYVSSFLSDQILRYDGQTGQFIDVFAETDGTPTGLNGPNELLFGPDGALYVTTEGCITVQGKPDFSLGYPSLVLRYDLKTRQSTVVIDKATPLPDSPAFVSFLGMALSPTNHDLYISDYANGIRRYDWLTHQLEQVLPTNYTQTHPSNNFISGLTFAPDGRLLVLGFDFTHHNVGSILQHSGTQLGFKSLVSNHPALKRPVGIVVVDLPHQSVANPASPT